MLSGNHPVHRAELMRALICTVFIQSFLLPPADKLLVSSTLTAVLAAKMDLGTTDSMETPAQRPPAPSPVLGRAAPRRAGRGPEVPAQRGGRSRTPAAGLGAGRRRAGAEEAVLARRGGCPADGRPTL